MSGVARVVRTPERRRLKNRLDRAHADVRNARGNLKYCQPSDRPDREKRMKAAETKRDERKLELEKFDRENKPC